VPKKIQFSSQYPNHKIPHPQPASRLIPEWYRKTPGVKDKQETIKKCIPILDGLTSGYIITLAADVWRIKDKGFHCDSKIEIVTQHGKEQTDMFPLPEGFDSQPYKWSNYWYIKTPKGYSTLFTHPINSPNLPFQTLTAVVDTDKHPLVINFPFFIRENFYGHIPAGTPIIQMIPFKRNDWEMEVIDNKVPPNYDRQWEVMGNAPMAWYKRKWWTKKSYT